MPFGRKSPLEALAHPGAILAYKYTQFRQKRREAASRRITEKELTSLHHKIVCSNYFYTIKKNTILLLCYTIQLVSSSPISLNIGLTSSSFLF